MNTMMLYVPVEGTFSVSTDPKNLNIDFLTKLLQGATLTDRDDKRLLAKRLFDKTEIHRVITKGEIGTNRRKLFVMPGFIKNAEWEAAYDATHGRAFFHLRGCAAYDKLVSSAALDVHADLACHMVSCWCDMIGTLIRNIDGSVTAGSETYKFRELPEFCYERLLEENARNRCYRFFPEAEPNTDIGIGAVVSSFDIIQLTVNRYYKNIPVRYEMSTDIGITWEPYTPEEDA